MPTKETKEATAKPAPKLSALAQRRLRTQQTAAQSPTPSTAPATRSPAVEASTERPAKKERHEDLTAENEELARQRAEIEKRLLRRVKEVQGDLVDTPMAEVSTVNGTVKETPVDSPPNKVEESALARIKREQEEKRMAGAFTDEDIEMMSVGEATDEDEAVASVPESLVPRTTQISSFVPTDINYTDNGSSTIFRLQPGENLVLVGIYKLHVIKGTVKVSGAKFSEDSGVHTVYAPMTHSLPVIEAASRRRKSNGGDGFIEICVSDHHSGILDVGRVCPTFNGIWKGPSKEHNRHSFTSIYSSTTVIPTVTTPPSWKAPISQLVDKTERSCSRYISTEMTGPPIILVAGPKGVGKSTFLRMLVNKILTTTDVESVAYLDADPGQPEFAPAGIVSLNFLTKPILGPPFTHTAISHIRRHNIGHNSPREDPPHYVASVADLVAAHTVNYPNVPLLINTCGWTKGIGLEVLQDILACSNLSDLVFLGPGASSIREIMPSHLGSPPIVFHEVPAAQTTNTRFSPRDLRMLHTMSYFHHQPTTGNWDFTTPLTGLAPWVVPYTGAERGIEGIALLGDAIASDEIATAVEGTIVAIVLVDSCQQIPALTETASVPILPGRMPLLECKGLAVIRAIDAKKGEVHLLTPVAAEEMQQWEVEGIKIVLVRGSLELPVWEMLMPGGAIGDGAPWLTTGDGKRKRAGEAVWRVRRNVMRRGHLV